MRLHSALHALLPWSTSFFLSLVLFSFSSFLFSQPYWSLLISSLFSFSFFFSSKFISSKISSFWNYYCLRCIWDKFVICNCFPFTVKKFTNWIIKISIFGQLMELSHNRFVKLWKGIHKNHVMMHEVNATGFNAIYDFWLCFAIVLFCFVSICGLNWQSFINRENCLHLLQHTPIFLVT